MVQLVNYLPIFLEVSYLLDFIYKFLILKGYRLNQIEKFVQELTYRDYYKKNGKSMTLIKILKINKKMFTD